MMSSPRPVEAHLGVTRTARYWTAGDPATASEVWIVLHGYRQLAGRFLRRFQRMPGLAGGQRAVVAPEALSRFYIEDDTGPHGPEARVGASWMTRSDREHEIADYVAYLDRLAETVLGHPPTTADPIDGTGESGARLVVFGFSQGAETASRWVTLGGVRPAEAVLWGGGLAADLDPAAVADGLGGAPLCLVVGDRDRWAIERADWTLRSLAPFDAEVRRYDYVGGHRLDPDVLAAHWPAPG